MSGESLKRVPPGYDPAHPFAEDLKRKDFGIHLEIADGKVSGPRQLDEIEAGLRAAAPLMRFVCDALKLPF
jgi:uncharacterized protein (DUF2461 family)